MPKNIVPFLSLEEMHGLIEEKRLRGHDLTIFVLSLSGYGKEEDNSELHLFFKLLKKNIHSKSLPNHFQIAVQDQKVGHWFGIDCYLKEGQLYLLVMDAVVFASSFRLVKYAALPIQSAKLFFYNGIKIQYDMDHCSFFTLDHLFRFSARREHWDGLIRFSNNDAAKKYFEFNEKECPASLAFIFKNIQSFRALERLPESLKDRPINKKKQLLPQVIDQHTEYESRGSEFSKKVNEGIVLKERKYMARGLDFFKPANYRKITSSRQGFEIIAGEKGDFIRKIINSEERTIYLKSLVDNNEALIISHMRDMLDIALCYRLNNFVSILLEKNLLDKNIITHSDICSLINKDFSLFKKLFEFSKNRLTTSEIIIIVQKVERSGKQEYRDYFSTLPAEEQFESSAALCC